MNCGGEPSIHSWQGQSDYGKHTPAICRGRERKTKIYIELKRQRTGREDKLYYTFLIACLKKSLVYSDKKKKTHVGKHQWLIKLKLFQLATYKSHVFDNKPFETNQKMTVWDEKVKEDRKIERSGAESTVTSVLCLHYDPSGESQRFVDATHTHACTCTRGRTKILHSAHQKSHEDSCAHTQLNSTQPSSVDKMGKKRE